MLLKSAAAVLLALAAALAPSLADDAGESQQSAKEEQAFGEHLEDESDSKVLQKNKFIFGSLSTTTYTGVAVSTSTVFFSCLLGTAATVCQGRRRRLRKNVKFNASPPAVYESESSLDSSQGAAAKSREEEDPNNQEVEEKSRFAFTAWTTSRTSTTVTVLFTNTSTTLRISIFCIAGSLQLPQFNCENA